MTFENALKYCENLEENGFDDWRLPTLYEIRTVDEKCEEEENSDFCAVTDSCEWDNCESELCGKCLKYADFTGSGTFWTTMETYGGKTAVFTVSTEKTEENQSSKNEIHLAKCIRLR